MVGREHHSVGHSHRDPIAKWGQDWLDAEAAVKPPPCPHATDDVNRDWPYTFAAKIPQHQARRPHKVGDPSPRDVKLHLEFEHKN